MAGTKNHDYHILPPDIWPLIGAFAALTMVIGGVLSMHSDWGGGAAKPASGGQSFADDLDDDIPF